MPAARSSTRSRTVCGLNRSGELIDASFGVRRGSRDEGRTWERVVLPPDELDFVSPDSLYDFELAPERGSTGSRNHMGFGVLVDETGTNVFDGGGEHGISDTGLAAIAGVLAHAPALAAILSPTINSYQRFGPDTLAPWLIDWGLDNRSAMIRIPPERGGSARMEVRLGDADWEVVRTPGHTPGHLALWQPDERLLVVGDALSDYDAIAKAVQHYIDGARSGRGGTVPAMNSPGARGT